MSVDELLARYPWTITYAGAVGAFAYLAWVVGGR